MGGNPGRDAGGGPAVDVSQEPGGPDRVDHGRVPTVVHHRPSQGDRVLRPPGSSSAGLVDAEDLHRRQGLREGVGDVGDERGVRDRSADLVYAAAAATHENPCATPAPQASRRRVVNLARAGTAGRDSVNEARGQRVRGSATAACATPAEPGQARRAGPAASSWLGPSARWTRSHTMDMRRRRRRP